MATTELERLDLAYEVAEASFLAAVRSGSARAELAARAREVATAADAYNTEAYRKFHAAEDDAWDSLDALTERTEVLSELWEDLASAYEV